MLNIKKKASEYDFNDANIEMLYPIKRMNNIDKNEFMNKLGLDSLGELVVEPLIYTTKRNIFNYTFDRDFVDMLGTIGDMYFRIDEVIISQGNESLMQKVDLPVSVFDIEDSLNNPNITFVIRENLMLNLGGYVTIPRGALISISKNYCGRNTIEVLEIMENNSNISDYLDVEFNTLLTLLYNSDINISIIDAESENPVRECIQLHTVNMLAINNTWDFNKGVVIFSKDRFMVEKYMMQPYENNTYVLASNNWSFNPNMQIYLNEHDIYIDLQDTASNGEQKLFILQYEY